MVLVVGSDGYKPRAAGTGVLNLNGHGLDQIRIGSTVQQQ